MTGRTVALTSKGNDTDRCAAPTAAGRQQSFHRQPAADQLAEFSIAPRRVAAVASGRGNALARQALNSPATALESATRSAMESSFHFDFSGVKVHADRDAARATRAVTAQAYTIGDHIVFGQSRYAPQSDSGRSLLAHELAHVVQQTSGSRGSNVGVRALTAEQQAVQAATAVMARHHVPPLSTSAVRLARQADTAVAEADQDRLTESEGEPDTPPPPPRRPDIREVNYAFFFAGGAYGRAARDFIRTYYPQHRIVDARSFEEMFDRLHADLRRVPHGSEARLRELVIVTHANAAGGLKIPLTRRDVQRRRFFNLWDLAALQKEFREGLHARFRTRRREVVSALFDSDTRVIVRGCEFGQAQEAVDALRSLFGGQPYVWAPRGFQGYETLPIGRSRLRTPEEAFDFLIEQGYLPPELWPMPEEQKREYIARVFGLRGAIPADFLVMGPQDYTALRAEIAAGRGTQAEAEQFKQRDVANIPSVGEFWGLSAPSALGEDPELDALSIDEIEARGRALNNPYRPQNAAMLQRLARAWERKGLAVLERCDVNDPLCGLPPSNIFGDSNIVAMDASRYPGPRVRTRDLFEEETLVAPPRTIAEAERAAEFVEPPATREAAVRSREAARPAPTEQPGAPMRGEGSDAYARARDFSKNVPPPQLPAPSSLEGITDAELGQQYLLALQLAEQGDRRLLQAVESEIERRIEDPEHPGFGLAIPRGVAPGVPANAGVEPDIALRILENVARGEHPWRPELGRVGGSAWFVTEGNPYVGRDTASRITIDVELVDTHDRLVFREAELLEIFERQMRALRPDIEAQFRRSLGIDDATPLTRKMQRNVARLLERAAEARMWEHIGESVRSSPGQVGEVALENSRFSRSGNGRFAVVADTRKIRLRGGVGRLLDTLAARGVRPDPTVTAAAEVLASRMRWAGRVRGAFRYGGRILVVVALANDAYRIYTARDRTRTVITTAGGWAGAVAAGALFAEVWTPADTAGPIAWVVHGVGTLLAGGIGYFVGSETTTWVYELVVDEETPAEE